MAFRVQVVHPGPSAADKYAWRVEIDDDEAPWLIVLSFVAVGNPDNPASREWLCTGYELRRRVEIEEATEPGDVPVITADVHRHIAERWDRFMGVAREGLDYSVADAARGTATLRARGQGRRGLPDEFYRGIADQYRDALASGQGPTASIAKAHEVARSTASNWVAEARERGHLGPATPGRAG